ncbi:TorD/DmsD family molecular chaperone [Salinilacihabitans rarus]|uniref:TorD/DmsD family molecular chaperone n=1 Tax=Salinilacihabitans rarus TaxID=2961596 RepID=UPI0020C90584|nr:molecular chaperone TorD family protein [Salinilacihabitans rarus]
MSETPSGLDDGRQLAEGYAVLARCWRRPTADLLDAAADALGRIDPAVRDAAVSPLRAEHARLFVGPGEPTCPPYESVYRDENGAVLGPSTRDVVEWYRAYDLGLDPDWPDLPDHVATELEFAAYLLDRGEPEACERFLDEHPRQWLGEFLADVERETSEPYYAALARATATAVDL